MGKQQGVKQRGVVLLAIRLIILVVGLVLSIILFLLQQIPIQYEHYSLAINIMGQVFLISQEQRLAILVILSGALGNTVHVVTSFSKYLGWAYAGVGFGGICIDHLWAAANAQLVNNLAVNTMT